MVQIYKRYFYITMLILMISILSIYLYFIYQSIFVGTLPLYSDEYIYSKNLEIFLINHTLSPPFTFDEQYSQIGSFSFHGFAYTLIYGILGTILHIDNLMILNIFISVAILLFIIFIKEIDIFNQILLSTLITTYCVFFLYSYSYMIENIHLFTSITITYLLYKVFLAKNKKDLILYFIIFSILLLHTKINILHSMNLRKKMILTKPKFNIYILSLKSKSA